MNGMIHPLHPVHPLHPLHPKNGRDVLSILSFLVGFVIVNFTISSAVRTFVLPRSAPDKLNAFLFRTWRRVFNLVLMRIERYETRDIYPKSRQPSVIDIRRLRGSIRSAGT